MAEESSRTRGDRSSVVVLLGGGLDSSVVLQLVWRRSSRVICLHYDYGQPALEGERRAIARICRGYRIKPYWRVLPQNFVKNGDEYECRNALFVLAAAAEFGDRPLQIMLGAHAGSSYYDCTPRFLESMQSLLDGYFDGRVILEAPLIRFRKSDIVAYGRRAGVPLSLTYSCTRRGDRPCGSCPSCLDRRALNV